MTRARIGRVGVGLLSALVLCSGVRGLVVLGATPEPHSRAWTERTAAQLRYLSRDLDGHADAMQRLFPEGRLFTLALTGLAWTELGLQHPADYPEAMDKSRRALRLAEDRTSVRPFGPAGGLPHGVFYEAWVARLRVGVVRLAAAQHVPTQTERDSLAQSCRRLAARFDDPALFHDSYPGAAWPADNVVGAAALTWCGSLVDPAMGEVAVRWLNRVKAREDPATGLIPHAAATSHARGSSSALMIPFLSEIDSAYARVQYRRLRAVFPTRLAGVAPVLREYPPGVSGDGDIDSGPLIGGASAPATVVGIAAASAVGDPLTARALRTSTEAAGLALTWNGKRRYAFGTLPVGDAFLAWASAIPSGAAPVRPDSPFGNWRHRWGGASLVLLIVGSVGLRWSVRRRIPDR